MTERRPSEFLDKLHFPFSYAATGLHLKKRIGAEQCRDGVRSEILGLLSPPLDEYRVWSKWA
jgi:hypothetical protein